MLYSVFHMAGMDHRRFGVFEFPRGGRLFLVFFQLHPLLVIVCAGNKKSRNNRCVFLYVIFPHNFCRAFQV